MDNSTVTFQEFLKEARSVRDRADAAVKQASADTEALYGIKDPACQGETAIPSCGDANHRSSMGIPANGTNLKEGNNEHNIMSVTKPNGTGQGEYITPRCGSTADAQVKSPTAPISKIAKLAEIASNLRASAAASAEAPAAAPAEAPAAAPEQEKAAAPAPQLPEEFASDQDLMAKLASYAVVALGSEEGRRAFTEILEREAGIKEACAIVNQAAAEVQAAAEEQIKAAAAQQSSGMTYTDFQLKEMSKQAHAAWVASFDTDLEKLAYAQGAADAEAMADAVDAGAAPEIPGSGDEGLTDDQILTILQELVNAGEVAPEEAEAILAALGEEAADGIDPEELAEALQEAVEAGQISPDQAAAIAEQVMGSLQGGAEGMPEEIPAGSEDVAAAVAAQDPAVTDAAGQVVEKAASVAKYLWDVA